MTPCCKESVADSLTTTTSLTLLHLLSLQRNVRYRDNTPCSTYEVDGYPIG